MDTSHEKLPTLSVYTTLLVLHNLNLHATAPLGDGDGGDGNGGGGGAPRPAPLQPAPIASNIAQPSWCTPSATPPPPRLQPAAARTGGRNSPNTLLRTPVGPSAG